MKGGQFVYSIELRPEMRLTLLRKASNSAGRLARVQIVWYRKLRNNTRIESSASFLPDVVDAGTSFRKLIFLGTTWLSSRVTHSSVSGVTVFITECYHFESWLAFVSIISQFGNKSRSTNRLLWWFATSLEAKSRLYYQIVLRSARCYRTFDSFKLLRFYLAELRPMIAKSKQYEFW